MFESMDVLVGQVFRLTNKHIEQVSCQHCFKWKAVVSAHSDEKRERAGDILLEVGFLAI